MKREVAAEIVDSLKQAGVDFVASLTEANLHDLVTALGEDPAIHHVPVTREEEGIGICAGAYLGGKKPAMVMMNAGFLLSANAFATVCIHPGIPVLMLIGHSGGVGEENAGHATVGSLTEPMTFTGQSPLAEFFRITYEQLMESQPYAERERALMEAGAAALAEPGGLYLAWELITAWGRRP